MVWLWLFMIGCQKLPMTGRREELQSFIVSNFCFALVRCLRGNKIVHRHQNKIKKKINRMKMSYVMNRKCFTLNCWVFYWRDHASLGRGGWLFFLFSPFKKKYVKSSITIWDIRLHCRKSYGLKLRPPISWEGDFILCRGGKHLI